MTARVIGLDLSVKSSGIALPDGNLRTIAPKAGAKDPARRLYEITFRLSSWLEASRPTLAVIEAYFVGGYAATALRLGEVGGAVRTRLFEMNIPYVEIPPTQLKMYATGHGTASKDDMVAAAEAEGAEPHNDDEADAFWLRKLGVQALTGVPPRYLQDVLGEVRGRAVRSVRWPAGVLS